MESVAHESRLAGSARSTATLSVPQRGEEKRPASEDTLAKVARSPFLRMITGIGFARLSVTWHTAMFLTGVNRCAIGCCPCRLKQLKEPDQRGFGLLAGVDGAGHTPWG